MNSTNFKSGDILEATHRTMGKGIHPIIFVSGRSEHDFIGAMITHHSDITKNIKMDFSHFENSYKVNFNNSYLVKARLIKPEEWGPFKKVGQLTERGINFVIKEISQLPEETFAQYFRRTQS